MLRVANIIEDGRLAGPQIRIVSVARELESFGIETTVVFPFFEGDQFRKRLEANRVRNIQLPINRLTKDKKLLLKYIFYFAFEIRTLYSYLKKQRFDLIHCSGGAWQYKGVVAGSLSGTKTIWHLNDTKMPFLIRICFNLVVKYFADGIIVAGRKVKEYYVTKNNPVKLPIFSIQAPVDTHRFNPKLTINSHDVIAKYDGIKVVSICNINPTKGIENILKAASLVQSEQNRVNFFVVGPVYNSQLKHFKDLLFLQKKLKLSNVHFIAAEEDVRGVLKAADIFICTSLAEASPTVVWEAMSMEKAIVSFDVGDVKEFIKDDHNGYIVPVNDVQNLSEKISALVNNTEKRKLFGVRSRKIAKKYLDIKIISRQHNDAYSRMIFQNS